MLFAKSLSFRLAALLLLAAPAAALAADLGGYRPYSQPSRRPLDGSYRTPLQHTAVWTGLYAGLHGGYGWGTADGTAGGASASFDTSGFLFGGHAGYNMQFDRVVAGLEIDGTWADIDGSRMLATSHITPTHEWLSSARVRLGYAVNDWMLPYITGGVALGGFEIGVREMGLSETRSETLVGYAIGGGVELKLTPNASARLEALHYGFGQETFNFSGGSIKGDADVTTVRAGLTFHFN